MGKTALHDAASKGNAEMVAYMMEQVNPNVDARDVVSREVGISFRPVALGKKDAIVSHGGQHLRSSV